MNPLNLIGEPEYQHVVLNHLPIVGLAVATLVLGVAVVMRNRGAVILGLILVALLAASVWPVIDSGESAYNRIRSIADPDGAALLKQHMLLADRWAKLFYLTALAAAAAVVLVWKRPKKLRLGGIPVVVLAVASLVAAMAIAKVGGEVRHPEFRSNTELVPDHVDEGHDHEH